MDTKKATNKDSKEDTQKTNPFLSKNGMQTHVWGPLQWLFLHIISFNYPEHPTIHHKIYYWDYLMSLRHVLPCRHCRENMQRNLIDANVSYDSFAGRQVFSRFIFDFHNKVNVSLAKGVWDPEGKGSDDASYEYLKKQIECVRARCSNKPEVAANIEVRAKEKGCTEPIILGCPAAIKIKLGKRVEPVSTSIHFFGNIMF